MAYILDIYDKLKDKVFDPEKGAGKTDRQALETCLATDPYKIKDDVDSPQDSALFETAHNNIMYLIRQTYAQAKSMLLGIGAPSIIYCGAYGKAGDPVGTTLASPTIALRGGTLTSISIDDTVNFSVNSTTGELKNAKVLAAGVYPVTATIVSDQGNSNSSFKVRIQ